MSISNQIWHDRTGKVEGLQPKQSATFGFERIKTFARHNLLLPITLSPEQRGQICHVIVLCVFFLYKSSRLHVLSFMSKKNA